MQLRVLSNEKLLVKKCLQGDRKCQRLLYEKYNDALYTIACRITNNKEDAKDALQEGFVSIFLSMNKFQWNSSLYTWMRTIIIRAAIKKVRSKIDFNEIEGYEEDFSFYWDDNLTGEALSKAIAKLNEGYRTVFLLIEVEGYKHKEVAEMLGVSEGTSKSQLFHAKKALQNELKDLK